MDSQSKIDLDKIMSMTLDEYAIKTGLFTSSILKKSRFNKFGSQKDNNDVDMDMIDEEELLRIDNDEDLQLQSIFKNDGSTNEPNNDLRNKIIGLNSQVNGNQMPCASSQQWRLLHPNNAQKQAGMPPLVQKNAPTDTEYNLNRRQNIINNNYGAKSEQESYRNKYNRRNDYKLRGNMHNNRRGQHYGMNQQQFNNAAQNTYQRFRNSNCALPNGKDSPNNMIIQIERSPWKNGPTTKNNNQTGPEAPVFNQQQPPPNTNVSQILGNDVTSAITPVNVGNGFNLMQLPLIAATLMESLRNGFTGIPPVQQPAKYDMKLQKEIHLIQNKPMVYKCPTGEIISSDGPGLSLGFKPSSTGISMNQRFS